MNQPEQNHRLLDVCDDKTTCSPNNTTFHSLNNTNINESVLENSGLNGDLCDPGKYFDLQRMMIDQNNVTLALKMSEYEKALVERDYTIKSLHTNMMNSQNNNYVLNNQCKNIMEKTKSVNDTCVRLNTSFTNICERLNRLGDTVDNARTRQKEVMTLVDQTTSTFQEKILSISDTLDESLKQVTMEKIRTKQDLEMLQNKYSLDIAAFKTNLQECTNEIEYLKNENNILLEKLNDSYIKLNEEKETVLYLNQRFETELREKENQNLLLINQNKSMNEKFDEIGTKNQILEDELNILKNSLNENQKQLNIQSNIVKEQSELLDNLKIIEELNDKLKKDNFTLKEQNEYLEQINTNLVEDISSIKSSQHGIQEETESKFKDMCENYDNLLKMQDERLKEQTEKLVLQKEKEIKNQSEVIELKEEIETSNKTITGLREELQANYVLIPELQKNIDDLNKNLVNAYQKLRDSTKDLVAEKNELEKEKIELENQSKEHFGQIEKLTSNYMKYKSKAKQLYVEVMRLKYQVSRSEPKKKIQQLPPVDTIEELSIVEFNDQNVSSMNVSIHSTSNKPFQKSNISSLKRNGSPLIHIGSSKVKKHLTSVDVAASHTTTISPNILKQINDARKIENSLNSSFKSINLKHEEKNANKIEKNNEYNQSVNDNVDYSTASPHQIRSNVSMESNKSQVKSMLNADSIPAAKKKFKIPTDIKLSQKKIKSTNVQKNDWTKPNSPVVFTVPSPKLQPKSIK
ncbi:putative leucine-rich repeat-containing protein DDB_G0290503 isoform X2 [Myzus persicae]|uniref:putative leucine-rich repeat-containing protein DDB_G0290503 isoform X2 n=1 Tax=Myzus persicae TaxID=13164 RepID=UPI000B936E9F|nr:putative leucine-rich repeat-containing protein DDB_G0290503 isoform X2 [Myzus persicae]